MCNFAAPGLGLPGAFAENRLTEIRYGLRSPNFATRVEAVKQFGDLIPAVLVEGNTFLAALRAFDSEDFSRQESLCDAAKEAVAYLNLATNDVYVTRDVDRMAQVAYFLNLLGNLVEGGDSAELRAELASPKDELSAALQRLAELYDEVKSLKKELEDEKQKVESTRSELDQVKEEKAAIASDLADVEEQCLQIEYESAEKIKNLEAANAKIREDKDSELQKLRTEFESVLESWKLEQFQKDKKITDLEAAVEAAEAKLHEFESSLDQEREEFRDEVAAQCSAVLEGWKLQQSQKEQQIADYVKTANEEREKNAKFVAIIQSLEGQLARSRDDAKALETKMAAQAREIEQSREMQEEKECLEMEITHCHALLDEKDAINKDLFTERADLNLQLNEQNREMNDLKSEIKRQKKERKELLDRIHMKDEEMEQYDTRMSEQLVELEDQLEQATRKSENLIERPKTVNEALQILNAIVKAQQ